MVNLVIADDHQVILDGIESLIEGEADMQVVGKACNGKQLIKMITSIEVDMVLLDINMPVMDGIESVEYIKTNFPDIKIVVLTMYNDKGFVTKMVELGVNGYILKNTGKRELLNAIRMVLQKGSHFSVDVMSAVIEGMSNRRMKRQQKVCLTKREKQILIYIVNGDYNKEIGEKLNIAVNTVETHRKNIISKLHAKNTAHLVRIAIENKLVPA
ncbi:response regulator [Chondrinema litorale]|uniref:response regulator n=1 Tax=Chondrinema litorale TaxID=2994555 RepID=UPI0025426EB1|nr:response regulator transcription factor [Chondrinema litorale]UZR96494.1 response regulator transcription factor [Chondrinema litorale]